MRSESGPRDRELAELAKQQHGVVAKRQVLALGVGPGAVKHRLRTGRLHVVHHGVYAVGHARLTLRGRWMAAVLSCGEGALLSHWDAAALSGLMRPRGTRYHVTVATRGRANRPGIEAHRVRSIDQTDRAVQDSIPLTSIPRTLLDLAEVADQATLENAYEEAIRQERLDLRAVEDLRERSRGRRGLKPLTALLETHDGHAPELRSELEQRFRQFCRDSGLPRPQTNVLVGGFLVDAVWHEAKLVVEVDSWEYHRGRRAFESDRARDAALHAAGYVVIRITYKRLVEEPEAVKAQLQSLIGERSGWLP